MFVVKTKLKILNTEAPGIKLEKTIKCSKKSAGGIIGQIRQNAFVSEWELACNEILAICKCFSGVTKLGKLNDSDSNLYHERCRRYSDVFTESVQKLSILQMKREIHLN